jgi:hypothetical protein
MWRPPPNQSRSSLVRRKVRLYAWPPSLGDGSPWLVSAWRTSAATLPRRVVDKKADYVLALKGNQGSLREDVGAEGHRLQGRHDQPAPDGGRRVLLTHPLNPFGAGAASCLWQQGQTPRWRLMRVTVGLIAGNSM